MKIFFPKVSIIIPVYNGSNYMRDAIDSALAQSYKKIEIIVVNDGSVDGGRTENIAKSYGNKITYFYKKNGGVGSAVNYGINHMSGEYFSWLSHDDIYLPNKIETQIEYLRRAENKDLILFTDFDCIDENARYLYSCRMKSSVGETNSFNFYAVLYNVINICSLLIPAKCFSKIGLFNEKLLTTQDYELLIKLSDHYQLAHIPVNLVRQRFHENQGTRTISSFIQERDDLFINYINSLTDKQILKLKKTKPDFYITIALGFVNKNDMNIAEHAFRLFLRNFFNCKFNYLFRNTRLLLLFLIRSRLIDNVTYYDLIYACNLLKNPRKWGEFILRLLIRIIRLFRLKMDDKNKFHCDH